MKPGDLLMRRKITCRPKILGVLLEEPKWPKWGNFPKRYLVLTPKGTVEEVTDEHKHVIYCANDKL